MSNDDHETPAWLFEALDRRFHFTLDVCAMPWNAKTREYLSPTYDGLEHPWEGICWLHPPYAEIDVWVAKAWAATHCGATVVALLPARTETRWFHDYVLGEAQELFFVRRRLGFNGAGRAPFASIVVVWHPEPISVPLQIGVLDEREDPACWWWDETGRVITVGPGLAESRLGAGVLPSRRHRNGEG